MLGKTEASTTRRPFVPLDPEIAVEDGLRRRRRPGPDPAGPAGVVAPGLVAGSIRAMLAVVVEVGPGCDVAADHELASPRPAGGEPPDELDPLDDGRKSSSLGVGPLVEVSEVDLGPAPAGRPTGAVTVPPCSACGP